MSSDAHGSALDRIPQQAVNPGREQGVWLTRYLKHRFGRGESESSAAGAPASRHQTLVDQIRDYAIFMLDPDGRVATWNAGAERIKGYTAEEIIGSSYATFFSPDARREGRPDDILRRAVDHGVVRDVGIRVRKDGSEFYAEATITALRDGRGLLQGFAKVTRDVTDKVAQERALVAAQQRFARSFEKAPIGMALCDFQGRITEANEALGELLGRSREELGGLSLSDLDHPADAGPAERVRRRLLEAKGDVSFETRLLHATGRTVWAQVAAAMLHEDDGSVEQLLVQVLDISEQRRVKDLLAHQAVHDPLTGLPNRLLMLDRIEHAFGRCKRQPDCIAALLFIDLDRFKPINDTLGHDAGDQVLLTVARRLATCVRPGDTVARLGGDEFTILCEGLDDSTVAEMIAARAREAIEQPMVVAGRRLYVGASVGIALCCNPPDSPASLLADADAAMYEAKARGHGGVVTYSREMRSQATSRIELETRLREGIERDEFVVVYQPQFDLNTGLAVGVEALLRWRQDPNGELVAPGSFIPLAEETGLIIPIGRRVLEQACGDLADWCADHPDMPPLRMSVNLSAAQFLDEELAVMVDQIISSAGVDPTLLELEVTESVLMRDAGATLNTLLALKGRGVRLAIDDFGTGYSSLAYLQRFPVDILKIDRAFVEGLGRRTGSGALIGAMVSMGQALGMTVVAEGIETAGELQELKDLGCDVGQGFHLGRPQPLDSLSQVLGAAAPSGAGSAKTAP